MSIKITPNCLWSVFIFFDIRVLTDNGFIWRKPVIPESQQWNNTLHKSDKIQNSVAVYQYLYAFGTDSVHYVF